MVLAWMLIVPVGILFARYGRTLFTWFPVHRAIQIVGAVFILIGSALAFSAVASRGGGHFTSSHGKSGIGLLVAHGQQMILGIASHWYRGKTGRRWIGYLHMPLGIGLMGEFGFGETFTAAVLLQGLTFLLTCFRSQLGPSTQFISALRVGNGAPQMLSATLSMVGLASFCSSTSLALPFSLGS